jgi:NAD(P)-dependent dehydrogenase (short-subunit alcohol dehydrogenase family)
LLLSFGGAAGSATVVAANLPAAGLSDRKKHTVSTDAQRLTIVVGASRGIGRHLAGRAVERGDSVLACSRDGAELAALLEAQPGLSGSCEVAVGDFLSGGDNLHLIAERLSRHSGRVSLIVTAGTIGPVGALHLVDVDEWTRALELNVSGPARILSAMLPLLSAGDLVVLFSGGGVGGPNPQPNVSSYTTSKAALMHLLEVVARENPDGPALVAIAPGAFPTGFTDPVLAADPALAGQKLLDDVRKTQQGPFDTADLDRLLDYLETVDVGWLSGSCLSARRDTPSTLRDRAASEQASPDLFRLRRVDGAGVVVRAW